MFPGDPKQSGDGIAKFCSGDGLIRMDGDKKKKLYPLTPADTVLVFSFAFIDLFYFGIAENSDFLTPASNPTLIPRLPLTCFSASFDRNEALLRR